MRLQRPASVLVLLVPLLAGLGSAHAAGRAEVNYVDPASFTDAGWGSLDRERTLAQLTAQFERLAQRLPDGQVLRVSVTDVDLAGEIDPFSFHPVRVLGEVPDAPRLALSYELRDGDRVLARGDDSLKDMGYLFRRSGLRGRDALPYESRMLDEWFGERFAAQVASAPGR